jgi:hypothetical protein
MKNTRRKQTHPLADAIARCGNYGTEHTTGKAICLNCGWEGRYFEGYTDWGTESTWWEGFENLSNASDDPDEADEMVPLCSCGSTDVVCDPVGELKRTLKAIRSGRKSRKARPSR